MSQENVETVRRHLDAVGREDYPAALACLDSDLEWIPHRAATEGAYHGHEGWEQFVADTWENFDVFEPRFDLRDLGGQVLAWGTIRVSGKGSGIDMEFPVGGIFDCSGGKITRWQDFGSKEKALEAAGLSE
jgi:ketosteroid isomerase-like protein